MAVGVCSTPHLCGASWAAPIQDTPLTRILLLFSRRRLNLRSLLRISPSPFRRSHLSRWPPAQPIERGFILWNPFSVRPVVFFIHCRPSSLVHLGTSSHHLALLTSNHNTLSSAHKA